MLHTQCDYRRAEAPLEQAIELFRELGEQWRLALSLGFLGQVTFQRGQYARAVTLHQKALQLYLDMGDVAGVGTQKISLGRLAYVQGDHAAAAVLLEEGLALVRQADDKVFIGWGLWDQAKLARDAGEYGRATACLDEALALFREVGDPVGIAAQLGTKGIVRWLVDDDTGALALTREAVAVPSNRHGIAAHLSELACVLTRQGEPEQAVQLFAVAERERDAMGLVWEPRDGAWFDQVLASTRAGMEASDWDAAWAEGQAMSLEQAVASALERTDGGELSAGISQPG